MSEVKAIDDLFGELIELQDLAFAEGVDPKWSPVFLGSMWCEIFYEQLEPANIE